MVSNLGFPATASTTFTTASSAPAFPLSSPQHEALTSFKPVHGIPGPDPKDAFLSPNPFASSSSDDDSGSSSGQDEFHLERYSQETQATAHNPRMIRKQSRRQKQQDQIRAKKARPGLNIVTNFSIESKRSKTDGLVIDQVQSQRPRLGPRYATSIKSAKAEHMDQPLPDFLAQVDINSQTRTQVANVSKRAIARQAVSKLQRSQIARTRAAEDMQAQEAAKRPKEQNYQLPTNDSLMKPVSSGSGYSSGARSIVIGMSVPEDEIETHHSRGGSNNVHYQGNTPDTLAIVITPADDTESWKPPFFSKQRPPSSVYSSHTRTGLKLHNVARPPVPRIPTDHAPRDNTTRLDRGALAAESSPDLHHFTDDSDDRDDHRDLDKLPRSSIDSHEPILPPADEDKRHKSQGWWNLMLSPMLSRKGTIAERSNDKSPETPPVPTIPADIALSGAEIVSPLTSESPETPRRAGLASARASVWSRWTTWERSRDGTTQPDTEEPMPLDAEQPRDMTQITDPALPMSAPEFGKGLAAEYYHACAVEQLTRVPYFECENHSCSEQLPRLQSVFDKGVDSSPSPASQDASRHVDGIVDTDPMEKNSIVTRVPSKLETSDLMLDRGISFRSEPEQLSPNVRQADTATVIKARRVEALQLQQEPSRVPLNPFADRAESILEEQDRLPSPAQTRHSEPQSLAPTAITTRNLQPPILSPGPVSPALQRTMVAEGAVPMTQVHHPSPPRLLAQSPASRQQALAPTQPLGVTVHNHTYYGDKAAYDDSAAIEEARKEAMERLESTQARTNIEHAPQAPAPTKGETAAAKESAPEKKNEKKGIWSKLKRLLPNKTTAGDDGNKKNRRRWTLIISLILFLIVLACILLATLLTRAGDGTPVQSQWLNLTGYPPVPTGISTIARPDVVKQQSKCVAPNTMWSCALPKEYQFEVAPKSPDQPNFRFQIVFRNGTVPANMTIPVKDSEGSSISRKAKRASDPFTNDLFTPNPSPPSRADQIFMGNTTDNITQPFEGEQTPFFITFIPVFPIDPASANATTSNADSTKLDKRQASNSSNAIIPAPAVLDDGSAAPANLLPIDPFPTSQPIQLYNRGQPDEHYGFYMYFDKAIFLHSTAPLNTSEFAQDGGIDPDDVNGGSTRDQSQLRCTFSQTRFLVHMWTNPAFGATLLSRIADNSTDTTQGKDNNSATDFSRPGSFPYPTTISIDRHGGNINKKAVYCYGVDALQVLQTDVKTIVPEFRGVEGNLINPAPALVNGTVSGDSDFDQEAGGIDGGTGGCECVWQNWD